MWKRAGRDFFLVVTFVCCATSTSLQRVPKLEERQAVRKLALAELEEKTKQSTPEDNYSSYQTRYLLAAKAKLPKPEVSCQEFQALSEEAFWGRELAFIRALEVCPATLPAPGGETTKRLVESPWLRLEFVRVLYQKSLIAKNEDDERKWGFELAKLGGRKKDRVKLVQRSLELAKIQKKADDERLYLQYLSKLAPRFKARPTKAEYFDVADDFRQARDFAAARKYYSLIASDKSRSSGDRIKALEAIAKTHKLQGNKTENIKGLLAVVSFIEKLHKKSPRDKRLNLKLVDSYVQLARAKWTEQKTSEAVSTLESAEKNLKGKTSLEQVYWLRGRIDEENGDLEKALAWMEKALLQKPAPQLLETVLWQKAWLQRKMGKLEGSLSSLKSLAEKSLSPFSQVKFQYWHARTLQDLKKEDEANSKFNELKNSDPFGYYGMLAFRETKTPLVAPSSDRAPSGVNSEGGPGFDQVLFLWLLDVSEDDIARRYLEHYLNKNPGLSKEKLSHMAKVGLFNRVYGELGSMDFKARNTFISENLDFFFPRSFSENYELAAQTSGAEQALLLAITRQESGFDPLARSHADAFGLMQVLPEVAEGVAARHGINYSHAEDLFLPEVNVPIGAHFIQSLLRKFDSAFIPAVGSYNASESAIRNWIKTRYRGDPAEFIEEIPYEETKSYIKLVMRNFVFYKLILSPKETIEFPESVFRVQ